MNYLLSLLNRTVGNQELAQLLFVVAIGLSVVLAVATVTMLVMGLRDPLQRRLSHLKHGQTGSGVAREAPSNLQLLLEQVGQRGTSAENDKNSATRTLLIHAGYRSPAAPQVYWSVRLLLPLMLLGLTLLALPFIPKLTLNMGIGLVATVIAVGWLSPAIYVDKRKQARMTRLLRAFPDALDLMVVCVESGLALPQAIERVADEMAVSQPELATELALVNSQMRAGIHSTEALKQLAERTGLEEIHGLVSLLAQSIRFGSSIGATLRIYSEEFRDRRKQLAEEKAAKIGTNLIFPLVFCLWPSFFLVAIGPALLSVLKVFGRI